MADKRQRWLILATALARGTSSRSFSLMLPWLPIERQLNGRRKSDDVGKNSIPRSSKHSVRIASAKLQGTSRGCEAIFRGDAIKTDRFATRRSQTTSRCSGYAVKKCVTRLAQLLRVLKINLDWSLTGQRGIRLPDDSDLEGDAGGAPTWRSLKWRSHLLFLILPDR
jgi:hypothetical protein